MLQADAPPAIPLWINGHAFLTLAPGFMDVCNPMSGEVLRRIPLCGIGEARKAVDAARDALAAWVALSSVRAAMLASVGNALAGYAAHFAKLIVEETGKDAAAADDEVAVAVSLLRTATPSEASDVLGVVGDAAWPLLGALQIAVPALAAGATVVIKPAPQAPSALFAVAELTARCAFPEGVFNILHGAEDAVDGLREAIGGKLLFS
jgi:succinate-semialdehyde dehydrogenase / glutarate-semialdehyde dehydrogenase